MKRAITVEKRVAVALWRLATNCECRTLATFLKYLDGQSASLCRKFSS